MKAFVRVVIVITVVAVVGLLAYYQQAEGGADASTAVSTRNQSLKTKKATGLPQNASGESDKRFTSDDDGLAKNVSTAVVSHADDGRPPLLDLIADEDKDIRGDVQWLLDFAIVGTV
jgi:hypothetical protein